MNNLLKELQLSNINRISFEKCYGALELDKIVVKQIEELYRNNPEYKDAFVRYALLLLLSEDYPNAIALCERDVNIERVSWWGMLRYAEALYKGGQESKAFKQIESVYAEYPEAVNGYAEIAFRLGKEREQESGELFKRDLTQGRLSPGFQINYAEYLVKTGSMDKAVEQVQVAYDKNSALIDGYARIGRILYVKQKDYNQALQYYLKDRQADRISSQNMLFIAKLYAHKSDVKNAEETVEQAYKADGQLKDGYAGIGHILFQVRKDCKEELKYFLKDLQDGRLSEASMPRLALLISKVQFYHKQDSELIICSENLLPWLNKAAYSSLSVKTVVALLKNKDAFSGARRLWISDPDSADNFELLFNSLMLVERFDEAILLLSYQGTNKLETGAVLTGLSILNRLWRFYFLYTDFSKYLFDPAAVFALKRLGEKWRGDSDSHKESPQTIVDKTRVLLLLSSTANTSDNRFASSFIHPCRERNHETAYAVVMPGAPEKLKKSNIYNCLKENGSHIIGSVSQEKSKIKALKETFQAIKQYNPDVIVTFSMGPGSVLLLSSCPKAKLINIVLHDYNGTSLPYSDCLVFPNISKDLTPKNPQTDNVVGTPTRVVQFCADIEHETNVEPIPGKELGIPDDAYVLCSAGRTIKFLHPDFWKMINTILLAIDNSCFLLLGSDPDNPQLQEQLAGLPEKIQQRIIIIKHRPDYKRALAAADLYIDSFPEGGGYTVFDAVRLNIPTLTFKNPSQKNFSYGKNCMCANILPDEHCFPRNEPELLISFIKKIISSEYTRKRVCASNLQAVDDLTRSGKNNLELLLEVVDEVI